MLIPFRDLGSAGIQRDGFGPEMAPGAFTSGNNVRFSKGFLEKISGQSNFAGTLSDDPHGLFSVYVNGIRYLVYAGTSEINCVTAGTHTDITGPALTCDPNDIWTGGVLPGGMLVMNNPADQPMYWAGDPGTPVATLTDWTSTTRAQAVRPFLNFLFALNINKNGTEYERLAMWSSAADVGSLPAEWTPSSTNDAGEQDLDVSSPLVDCIGFNDRLLIFSETETVAATFIGAPYTFRFQTISRTHGLLTQRCAAIIPNVGVLAVTKGDIVIHTGSESPQSIASGRMQDWFFDNLNPNVFRKTFVVENLWKNEVWICFPSLASTGACDKALIYNFVLNTWTTRDLPDAAAAVKSVVDDSVAETFATISGTFSSVTLAFCDYDSAPQSVERVAIASVDGSAIYLVDGGSSFAGTAISASAERLGLTFDKPDKIKTVRSLRPRVDAADGVEISVYVGASFDPESDYTWSGPHTFTVGSDMKVDAMVSGRYIGVRFESTAASPWRLRSFDLDIQLQGDY